MNDIGPYEGTVFVSSGLFIWDVTGNEGDWTIDCGSTLLVTDSWHEPRSSTTLGKPRSQRPSWIPVWSAWTDEGQGNKSGDNWPIPVPLLQRNPWCGGCRLDGLWSGGFGVFGWGRVGPGSGFRQLRFGVGGL